VPSHPTSAAAGKRARVWGGAKGEAGGPNRFTVRAGRGGSAPTLCRSGSGSRGRLTGAGRLPRRRLLRLRRLERPVHLHLVAAVRIRLDLLPALLLVASLAQGGNVDCR
jgi:hypothetical protein